MEQLDTNFTEEVSKKIYEVVASVGWMTFEEWDSIDKVNGKRLIKGME